MWQGRASPVPSHKCAVRQLTFTALGASALTQTQVRPLLIHARSGGEGELPWITSTSRNALKSLQ